MPNARRRRTVPPNLALVDSGPPIQSVSKGRSKTLSICVYADPGVGKTVLVGTCAELPGKNGGKAKVLIIRPPVDHTDSIDNEEVDEWVVTDWASMDDALLYCRNDGAGLYDWVWLDSLSLWQDQGLDDIWDKLIEEKPHRAKFGLDKGEYGVNMHRIGVWIRHMVGCPHWHFGVTCHPRVGPSTEDEEDPQEKLMPWVQGKMMAPKICGYMNIVAYLHWDTVRKHEVRVIDTNSSEKFYAKYAVTKDNPLASGRLINPTMPKLMEAIATTRAYNLTKAGVGAGATTNNGKRTNRRQRRAATGRR
jgi:hypothetical protein